MRADPPSFLRTFSLLAPNVAVLGVCLVWGFQLKLQDRRLAAEMAALASTNDSLQQIVQRREKLQPQVEGYLMRARSVIDGSKATKWTPAVSRILTVGGPGIEVTEVFSLAENEECGPWRLTLRGTATGPMARTNADLFRQAAQAEFEHRFGDRVKSHFEKFDDASPADANGSGERVNFAIDLRIDVESAAKPTKESAR